MHPLLTHVRAVAHQARRLVLRGAIARWLCLVLAAAFLVGAADYLFRFRERPLRWLGFFSVGAAAVLGYRRWIEPPLAERWSERQVAQWIEQRMPDLRDRLSSAVAFLNAPAHDHRFGSPALRAEVIRRTEEVIAGRDLTEVLDRQYARRALQALWAVAVVWGAVLAWDADSAVLAMRRLVMPWSSENWPRQHHLQFVQKPTLLPYGADFEVELINEAGRLPSEVTLLYWFEGDGEGDLRAHRMVYSGGKMTHRLPAVTQSFHYRAVGGDDQTMDWTALRVVMPPRITESRITLRPPSYSGRSPETSERRIRGLVGSQVEAQIRLDKPVKAAAIRFQNGGIQKLAAHVSADGRTCHVPASDAAAWILSTSGTYGWELTDREGMTVVVNANTEVDVVPDSAPVLAVDSPGVRAVFTTRAIVPVRVSVKDDLGIQRIEFRRGDRVTPLSQFPAPGGSASDAPPQQHLAEYSWDLTEIAGLAAGNSLTFEVVADDFLPQSSSPVQGTIEIVSDTAFQQRLDEAQGSILQRLREALQIQRALHARTGVLVAQVGATNQLTPEDQASWPGLDPGQRRVASLLEGEEGAAQLVHRLLSDIAANRWESPQLVAHLTTLQRDLHRLSQELLPPIQRRLADADRQLRFESPRWSTVVQAWSDVAEGQQQVIVLLETMVDQLGQWDRYRNLAQEVRQVMEEQAAIQREIQELSTAGRSMSQLSPEERARLQRLAHRLSDLASQLDRLGIRLDQIQQRLNSSNPSAAQSLQQALQVLQQNPVGGEIRAAGQDVAENRLGAATRGLEKAETGLQKLLAALEQRPEQDPRQLNQWLMAAVAAFAARQQSLMEQTVDVRQRTEARAANEVAGRELAQSQSDLMRDIHDSVQRVPEDSPYSLALELATQPMARASERLARAQFDDHTVQLERQALDFLKDLLTSLTAPPSIADQPAETQTGESPQNNESTDQAPSLAELKLIRLVHLEILRRTTDLEKQRDASGNLSERQREELESLAARQRRLAELLDRFGTPSSPEEPETGPMTAPPEPASSQGTKVIDERMGDTVFIMWLQGEAAPPSANSRKDNPPPGNIIDRSLLDDLSPAPPRDTDASKNKSPNAGEDVGQPSSSDPVAELSRNMRHIGSLLRRGNTKPATQQLQRQVATQLTTLIDELQQQASSSPNSQQQQPQTPPPSATQSPTDPAAGTRAGSGAGGTATDKESLSNWAVEVWGVLPDRVRQQIQNLGDEQFLPEYEEIIRQYYDQLAQRGRKKSE